EDLGDAFVGCAIRIEVVRANDFIGQQVGSKPRTKPPLEQHAGLSKKSHQATGVWLLYSFGFQQDVEQAWVVWNDGLKKCDYAQDCPQPWNVLPRNQGDGDYVLKASQYIGAEL